MPRPARILAAGGLLWQDADRRTICLVHRPRYDDWCLPKGRLDPNERFVEAALREALEETGHRASLDTFAGELFYMVGDAPKSVLYWNLLALDTAPAREPDADEVDEVAWLDVDAALARLTYDSERRLLADNANQPPAPGSRTP
ncbi:MAG: NUDIX hydrolase [Planctomycetes bacterium]|nr:NUDIX hydrolase [Planctomycetota bacterium]